MNNKWIQSFLTVAQEGSVNAAAAKLYISPQSLLQQINLLEEEVGVPLFIRSRSGMAMTLAGKEFLHGAQTMETVYATTLSRCRLASSAEGKIRIPMMSSIIVPRFMEEVCARYKRQDGKLEIELISDDDFGRRLENLRNLKYDIIEYYTLDGQHPDDVWFEYMSREPTWCIMSAYHPLSGNKIITPEELDGFTILSPGVTHSLMAYLQIYLQGHGIRTKIEIIENDRYEIIDSITRGGIYLANEEIAKVFVGCAGAPLDFDNHVQHGLACRRDTAELYASFFQIAREVAGEV
jgi:DNA-binding transcriptional LysR family regulator